MMSRRFRGEDGATLLFVIGFMVLTGLVVAGMVSRITSTTLDRSAFDTARNREYAADGAVETAIAQTRSQMQSAPAAACTVATGTTATIVTQTSAQALNKVAVQVDCTQAVPAFTLSGSIQRVVSFTACPLQAAGHQCPAGSSIIDTQVNFASTNSLAATSITVSSTVILSWSVNS